MSEAKPSAYDQLGTADKEAVNAIIGRDLVQSADPLLQEAHKKFLKVAFHDPGFTREETRAVEQFIEEKRLALAGDASQLEQARAYKQAHPSINPRAQTAANDFLVALDGDQFTPEATPPMPLTRDVKQR
jgi:hypothetical protein